MSRAKSLYAGRDLSAAELRQAGSARGLSEEIAFVRARLVKRVQAGRATDRFIQEQVTLLARLVVAQSRAVGVQLDERVAEVVPGLLAGQFAWLRDEGPARSEEGREDA